LRPTDIIGQYSTSYIGISFKKMISFGLYNVVLRASVINAVVRIDTKWQ